LCAALFERLSLCTTIFADTSTPCANIAGPRSGEQHARIIQQSELRTIPP
jgi:hypothetical protein